MIALQLASELGWRIFPCKRGGKRPLTADGFYGASADPNQIRAWAQAHPGCNWAVSCQFSDLLIVDLDPRNLPDGDDVDAVAARFPATFTVKTGSGGRHLYYCGARAVSKSLSPGIDLKSVGGYVLLPGSWLDEENRHGSDGHYAVLAALDLAPAPAGLSAPAAAQPRANVEAPRPRDQRWLAQARAWAAAEPPAVEGQNGDDRMCRFIWQCVRGWLLDDDGVRLVATEYNARCQPPWPGRDWTALLERQLVRAHEDCAAWIDWGSKIPSLDPLTAGPELVQSPDQILDEMNKQYCLLTAMGAGGKCRVIRWSQDKTNAEWREPCFQAIPDFKAGLSNREIRLEGQKAPSPVADWWLRHPRRFQAHDVVFDPSKGTGITPDGYLNLWLGYGVVPRPGSWVRMAEFIRDVIGAGNPQHVQYIIKWVAWVLQNPGDRAEVVLVLRGGKGTGKNTFLDAVCKLMGPHSLTINSPTQLTGRFNGHLQHCALLFANEAFAPKDRAAESALKALVTDESVALERKGLDVVRGKNRTSVCMASNYDWVVPASTDERRFAVFDVGARRSQEYFDAVRDELANGGHEAMLYDLLALDLAGWHPREDVPRTQGLIEQIEDSLTGADRLMYQMLVEGRNPVAPTWTSGSDPHPERWIPNAQIFDWARRERVDMTWRAWARAVARTGAAPGARQWRDLKGQGAGRGWALPALGAARAAWAAAAGIQPRWPGSPEDDWESAS